MSEATAAPHSTVSSSGIADEDASQSSPPAVPPGASTASTVLKSFFDSLSRLVSLDADTHEKAFDFMLKLETKFTTIAHNVSVRALGAHIAVVGCVCSDPNGLPAVAGGEEIVGHPRSCCNICGNCKCR